MANKVIPSKKKKKPKFNQNSAQRSAWRRIFTRSPVVIEIMNEGRRESVWYKKDGTPAKRPRVEFLCAGCNKWFMKKDVAVDHIDPVIHPTNGFTTWDEFSNRLFCEKSNLQILCKNGKESCHHIKTQQERAFRAQIRKQNKDNNAK